jgi:hypothetical protein
MPSLTAVYAKFGEVAEAAQLLETTLGNELLSIAVTEHGLGEQANVVLARKIFNDVDRKTLGQILVALRSKGAVPSDLDQLLASALRDRNRLNHEYYREHNFRRNSEEGRGLMLQDLEAMHGRILAALEAMLRISGVDFENAASDPLPTKHLPLKAT